MRRRSSGILTVFKNAEIIRFSSCAIRSATGLVAKSRSKTIFGLTSFGSGCVAERHDIVEEYTQEYPESQLPAIEPCSPPSSSDASRVLSARRAAAT